jgi:predicted nucleotide-binding protein (sugar kinase/HSP70/actin superfamily)
VIGHPYNVYDRYISMDLLRKLVNRGVEARTIETVDEADINRHASRLQKPMFWNYGRMAYGAALHMAESGEVDGFICLTSFGCGIDSFVNDLIERHIRRRYGIPLITMTVDEHSGEAGFNTRLEAFIDMLQWRRQNEDHISASG